MDYFRKIWQRILRIIQKFIPFSCIDAVKTEADTVETIQNYKSDINNLKKLASAIEDNPSIVIITDKNGIIEYINPAFTRITGYTKEETMGNTPGNILASGMHSPEFYRNIWETIIRGDIWQGEILNKNKQGEMQWQFVRISSIKDSKGDIINYVGIQEDISRQKHNELQLRILQQAVDKSPVSIVVTDTNGNISYVNPHFTKTTGYTYKEVVGNNPKILKGKNLSPEHYESLWKTISSGNVWQGEFCNIKKNGEEFWEKAIVTPIFNSDESSPDQEKKIDHYVAVKLDITDARIAEQALRDSEYLFKSIIASMEQGFWMVDNNWDTLEVNPALCSMLGLSEKDIMGRSIYEFLDEEHQKKIKAYIRTWNPHSRSSFEMLLLRPDHSHIHCLISPTPLFDQQNRQIGTFAVITDFTKRKTMESQLIEAKNQADKARERAENASRVKSEFLANMSHEIRTPMNSILGFLELALEDELSLSQKDKISIAHSSANALLSLLNDILDFSKIEQKDLTIEVRQFDIRELIRNRLKPLVIKAVKKGLELHYNVAPDIAEQYIGDPLRIGQVLVNIAGNAIKFTNHGKVEIKVEKYTLQKEHSNNSEITTKLNNKSVDNNNGINKNNAPIDYDKQHTILFSVKDTGIGMSPQDQKSVFEPFTQADASTTRRFGGTGLGTAISKQLVEMMGGKIWFESKKGEGTVFYFTIKMLQVPDLKEERDDKKMNQENKFSGLNILIADDLEENVLLTKLFLQRRSHRVTGVNNGEDAVKEFQKGNFDVILMDVHMPQMDGIEATLKIRELEQGTGRHIPIIAVTASVMSEERDIYERVGMTAVIGKPMSFKELDSLISRVVQASSIISDTLPKKNRIGEDNAIQGENNRYPEECNISSVLAFSPEILTGVDITKAIDNWSTPSVFGDVLSRFYDENKDVAEKIESLIKEDNISEVRRITHALKGLSGNLSLPHLFAIFTEMDKAAVDKKVDIVTSFLQELRNELDKVPSYIEAMFSKSDGIKESNTFVKSRNEKTGEKDAGTKKINTNSINSLLCDLMAACEQYSPDEVYPFLKELQKYIGEPELRPLVDKVEQFDFDAVKEEAMAILSKL